MEHNWLLYIAAFFTAFALSLLATPWAKKISFTLNAVDMPKERGMHKNPMPRLGGIAIVFGFLISILLMYPFVGGEIPLRQFIGFMIGVTLIVGLGVLDDIKGLKAQIKLCVQIVAALVVVYSGIKVDVVMWPFTAYLQTLSGPVTLLWIIGVTNAVNLIDGLDGLAAGISSIAALSLMVLCVLTGSPLAVALTASLAGACLGFLPRNFNPAEIFMGDTGATFLGFVLSVTSIMGVFKGYAVLAIVVSILPLGIPIFDTVFAFIRRLVHRKSFMEPDRGHLHHRLIDRGFTHKEAVCILYVISMLLGIAAILITLRDLRATIIVGVAFIVLSIMLYIYNLKKNNSK